MRKTAYISGYCPFLDEETTIKASFIKYGPLGDTQYAKSVINQCEYRFECGNESPEACPVCDQTFLWHDL